MINKLLVELLKHKVHNFENLSRKDAKNVLTFIANNLDYKISSHRTFYEMTMTKILNKNILLFTKNYDIDLEITRVRKNKRNKKYWLLKSLSYKRKGIIEIGRGNIEGKPVFYASDYQATSIFEVRPKLNDRITTTRFLCKTKFKAISIGIVQEDDVQFNKFPEYLKGIHDYFNDIFKEVVPNDRKELYFKTAIICDTYLKNADAIIYPSVATKLKGVNFIFKPEFANKWIKFYESREQLIFEYEDSFNFKIMCKAISQNLFFNNLLWWKKLKPECFGHDLNLMIYENDN